MEQKVIYPQDGAFMGRLAILTIREHLCGFHEDKIICNNSGVRLDTQTGHRVCLGCSKPLAETSLGQCTYCDRQYIDLNEAPDEYEPTCPRCKKEYDL